MQENFPAVSNSGWALARALVTGPEILMADEPTGDLYNRTAETVFGLVQRLHREYRLTSLIVTHNLEFARRCDRVLRLSPQAWKDDRTERELSVSHWAKER